MPPPVWKPTAQATQADEIATLLRVSLTPPGLGGCVPVQFWQPAAGAARARARPMAVIAAASISAAASARARRPPSRRECVIALLHESVRPWQALQSQQWMAKFCSRPLSSPVNTPTAQALVAEEAATAFRKSLLELGLGLAIWAHFVPFQCRMRLSFLVPVS